MHLRHHAKSTDRSGLIIEHTAFAYRFNQQ